MEIMCISSSRSHGLRRISYTYVRTYNAQGEQKESALAPSSSDYLTTLSLTYRGDSGPGVYVAWAGDLALYVGYGQNAVSRVKSKSGAKGRVRAFSEADRIEIYTCDSARQARHLEAQLIDIFRPPYNIAGPYQAGRSLQQLKRDHDRVFGSTQSNGGVA